MGDFAQNGVVPTLHNFKTRTIDELEKDLKTFSGYRPMELILPSLFSELEGKALDNIVKENRVVYGITTGFGKFAKTVIDKAKLE